MLTFDNYIEWSIDAELEWGQVYGIENLEPS